MVLGVENGRLVGVGRAVVFFDFGGKEWTWHGLSWGCRVGMGRAAGEKWFVFVWGVGVVLLAVGHGGDWQKSEKWVIWRCGFGFEGGYEFFSIGVLESIRLMDWRRFIDGWVVFLWS